MVVARSGLTPADDQINHGIPVFLDQLIKTLTLEQLSETRQQLRSGGPAVRPDPEVRVAARLPPRREAIPLATFLDNVRIAASFDALARGTPFTVAPVAEDIVIMADAETLAASLGNLLQNAFKFTKHQMEVKLRAYVVSDRVLIEVEDRCGGLGADAVDKMFLPFAQNGEDRSGLGLGLDISRRGVEANDGILRVRDLPGAGCIFTIDLPRHTST